MNWNTNTIFLKYGKCNNIIWQYFLYEIKVATEDCRLKQLLVCK